MGLPPAEVASNLDRLMRAWGVELIAGKVVGDGQAAMRVQALSNGRAVITPYLPWLELAKGAVDPGDAVTSQLQVLRLFSAGALRPVAEATTKLQPLLQSSADSMLIDAEKLQQRPDPVGLINAFAPANQRYVLAGRVSGRASSAFPDGAPAAADGTTALKDSAAPINVIVVADVDMLSDEAWLNIQNAGDARLALPTAHNADFAVNAIENLAGGAAFADLRGRGLASRPFTTVERLRSEAEARYLATQDKLTKELEEAQSKLASLEVDSSAGTDGAVLLSAAQQEMVRDFRKQVLGLRGQLRDVQRALNRDIERLETWVMLANIAAVPLVVAVLALAVALWRRALRRRPHSLG
jgi:ABC-type uncharacterized transport system involved in gliding motility auxiliary subunit